MLHTLALIQRHVDDPREVQRLVRGQERELRTWLYRSPPDQQLDFGQALEAVVAEVEDDHGVPIELVVVGERRIDEALSATLQAAREAMINAAKHAGTATISVYAEIEPAKVTVFVRDRGRGFDPDAVPSDRLGVKESIVGRMERHGGHATFAYSAWCRYRGSARDVVCDGACMMSTVRIRVVIVDDHRLFRAGVRAELGNGIEVVGEADDVASAVASIAATAPDVVLLDVHLPWWWRRRGVATDLARAARRPLSRGVGLRCGGRRDRHD